MKTFDIAVAAVIGMSSIAALSYFDPSAYQATAARDSRESYLRGLLLGFVTTEGVPVVVGLSFSGLCSALRAHSNASVILSAVEGANRCSPGEHEGGYSASLTLPLPEGRIVLSAWSNEGP